MKQTARAISTYSADAFGVCSALYELGGMVVMHDPSGCNSTYTTHDEPRWYDMESMIYISALTEMEAVMGDDEKLIEDIAETAEELSPKFIAIAGAPIPAMTGFDCGAVSRLIEQRTGIPCMGFATTGMNTYIYGSSLAFAGLAERFVKRDVKKSGKPSLNILGLTPLDFSVSGADQSIAKFAEDAGFGVVSRWAMKSSLSDIERAGEAWVNLVVSANGIAAARRLRELFGTPYVIGVPVGAYKDRLRSALQEAVRSGKCSFPRTEADGDGVALIGEGVADLSLAAAIETETGLGTRVLCATECPEGVLRKKDSFARDEEELEERLAGAKVVIADPLYRPVCPAGAAFISLPTEAFSGRLFRKDIPNLAKSCEGLMGRIRGTEPE